MSQINQAIEKREVEYLAFGSQEKIRLTIGMVRQYVAAPAYDKQTKQEILISEREAMQFMMLCKARQLNVWEGDGFAVPFWDNRSGAHKWALITSHNSFLKRGEINPAYEGMESGVMVEVDGEVRELAGDFVPDSLDGEKVRLVGGWAKVHRKDRKFPTYRRLKLSTFQKDFGQWVKDPAGMIVKCSEADALRSAFPNTCGGMYLREEMQGAIDVQASTEPAQERRPDFGERMRLSKPEGLKRAPSQEPPQETAKTPQDAPEAPDAVWTASAPETSQGERELEQGGASTATVETPQTQQRAEPQPEQDSQPAEDDPLADHPDKPEPAPEQPKAPFKPNPQETEALQSVRYLMYQNGISESQVMAWAKSKKVASEAQKGLSELAQAKIERMNAIWPNILKSIKDTKA